MNIATNNIDLCMQYPNQTVMLRQQINIFLSSFISFSKFAYNLWLCKFLSVEFSLSSCHFVLRISGLHYYCNNLLNPNSIAYGLTQGLRYIYYVFWSVRTKKWGRINCTPKVPAIRSSRAMPPKPCRKYLFHPFPWKRFNELKSKNGTRFNRFFP